jgi:hypothetical protein
MRNSVDGGVTAGEERMNDGGAGFLQWSPVEHEKLAFQRSGTGFLVGQSAIRQTHNSGPAAHSLSLVALRVGT